MDFLSAGCDGLGEISEVAARHAPSNGVVASVCVERGVETVRVNAGGRLGVERTVEWLAERIVLPLAKTSGS